MVRLHSKLFTRSKLLTQSELFTQSKLLFLYATDLHNSYVVYNRLFPLDIYKFCISRYSTMGRK